MKRQVGDAILAFVLAVLAIMTAVSFAADKYSCSVYAEITGMETKYKFLGGGCYVKTDRGWLLKSQVRLDR